MAIQKRLIVAARVRTDAIMMMRSIGTGAVAGAAAVRAVPCTANAGTVADGFDRRQSAMMPGGRQHWRRAFRTDQARCDHFSGTAHLPSSPRGKALEGNGPKASTFSG